MMWLPDEAFKRIIQYTPLISIDLIIRNEQGEVLFGKRVNAPAQGYWFVPGGRVRKNETLDDAFVRLVREELGIELGITRADAKFLGVFEHFYDENFFDKTTGTHYVVLGYEISFKQDQFENFPKFQHVEYLWISECKILIETQIHKYSRNYFK